MLVYSKNFVLSLFDDDEHYVVPLSYVYDEAENSVHFHCAKEGKKIEFIKRNPRAWELVVINKGIIEGACVNMYASAMSSGRVVFIEEEAEKAKVMNLFAERISSDVGGVKTRVQKLFGGEGTSLGNVIFGKIIR
jgi:nitroimidazol reductase NimA-like FMN-containing flavoprotein (pyridoxamine 5'-phosphate oxidase superfamily)